MNLHKQFIEETNQTKSYVEWLESKVSQKEPVKELEPAEPDFMYFMPPKPRPTDFFQTEIEYDVPFLSYQVEIWFHRVLTHTEMEKVESVISYWSAIPYTSCEGNYGISWSQINGMERCLIEIDFTKSSSDDYCAREILEKLALWIEEGTPVRKDRTQKHPGVIRVLSIKCDCP